VLAVRAVHGKRLGHCGWVLTSAEMADDDLFEQAGISAIEMKFSSTEVPLDADYGQEQLDELDSFNLLHADLDVAPQASDAEHSQWLANPPNFSTSAPDATMDVQLN
jgi:hypothetical protein